MNWDAIGAVGEIIGAFAVVISLVYLAVQIRRQSKESRAAAMHEIAVGFRESIASFSSSELAELFVKAKADVELLTEKEKFQLITSFARALRLWEEAYLVHEKGRLEEDLWVPIVDQLSALMDHAGVKYVWKMRKEFYNERFRTFVDELETKDYKI